MTKKDALKLLPRVVPQGDLPDDAPVGLIQEKDSAAVFTAVSNGPDYKTAKLLTYGELKELLK